MPEIVTPAADGAPETEVTAPDDFGAGVLAQFEHRTSTTAAPMDEMGAGTPFPGGVTVDASDQFTKMAAEINAQTVAADEPEVTAEPEPEPTIESSNDSIVEPEPEPTPDPGGYVWNYLDPTTGAPAAQRYDDRQIQEAIGLAAWARGLPDDVRDALGAVESGQAVAINRADYDRFHAWASQQSRGQRDSDLAKLDVDPDVAKVISDLRDEVSSLRGQSQGYPQQQGPGYNPAVTNALSQAVSTYRDARQLSQQEVDTLVQTAVQANIVNHFQQQGQQINPATGQLLAPADPAAVMYKSLDYALFQNPALHAAVVARTSQPTVLTGQPDPAAAPSATVTDITAKRARAASLASAPSAAVTPAPRTISQMSDQQRVDGMAEDIARAMNGTG